MRKLNVSESAKYNGQDMGWTERMETVMLSENVKVYHISPKRIKEFLAKETCFFSDKQRAVASDGYLYVTTIPAGTKVKMSITGEEIRVNINENTEIYEVAKITSKLTGNKVKSSFGGFVPEWKITIKEYK